MNAEVREESKCILAAEVLQSEGQLQLRVTGASMLPSLWAGDLLTVQSNDLDQVEPGDVVLYLRGGRFFVHRAVSKLNPNAEDEERFLITRGDSMPKVDAPVPPVQLLGKVIRVERDSLIFAPPKLSLLRLIFARALCHSNLFHRLVLRLNTRRNNSGSHFEVAVVRVAP
jgi:signal peptidase I